jgi:putative nucleotidyltransferase with HDIG domain
MTDMFDIAVRSVSAVSAVMLWASLFRLATMIGGRPPLVLSIHLAGSVMVMVAVSTIASPALGNITHPYDYFMHLGLALACIAAAVGVWIATPTWREIAQDYLRAERERRIAYDETLDAWVQALHLRDLTTEQHSLRVVDATVQLARVLGVPESDFDNLRRGALLHDIGKIGVPDAILLKPGPLTDEEWVIMRRHPEFARDILGPIEYLQGALDIPYGHHERWDGSGYPQGLAGEAIPLLARIFAVVDVWDAMRSDRPYRRAGPAEEVAAHLAEQSGRLFDPRVVEAFLTHVLTPQEALREPS